MVMKKIVFLCLVFVTALVFAQNASAGMLPVSSYADGQWQGSRFYDVDVTGGGHLYGRIDFAVYDTEAYPNEFIGSDGYTAPGDGQYIYAYQVSNDLADSDEAVAFFSVFAIDHSPLGIEQGSIGSAEDTPDSGVSQTGQYLNESNEVVWLFANGILARGEHSWFLMFSSDNAPVVGDYSIEAEGGQMGSPTPEPTTLALLGLGSAIFFTRKSKKSVR